MSVEQIILTLSYFGILLLMTANGISGFPSSQFLYIIAGYFSYTKDLNFILIVLFGTLGHSLGNIILYEIARRKGMSYICKFKLFPKKEIQKIQKVFEKKGLWFLFVGKLINPIKIIIPIPAGISKMNRAVFASVVFVTSGIWALVFTFLGYYFGRNIKDFSIYGIVMLVLAVVFMFVFYKFMNADDILKEVEKID